MKTLLKVIKGIITVLLVMILIVVIFQKITKNKLTIGNIYIFQIVSESMVPKYQIGDILVVSKADDSSLNIGDDVTYLGKESNLKGLTITHQIIEKEQKDGKYYYVTKGLANEIADPKITTSDIYGKVVYKTFLFSLIGRLLTNPVIYYLSFVVVGVAFSYEVVTAFFIKDDDEDDEKE